MKIKFGKGNRDLFSFNINEKNIKVIKDTMNKILYKCQNEKTKKKIG